MSEDTATTMQQEEIVYEYQPVDELNRSLGAKQVFKGKTVDEILTKVAEANRNLIKLNRELNKKIRLGTTDPEDIPQNAPHFDSEVVNFAPRKLTEEERIRISRDLLDPDKFDEASDMLFEAKIGTKPENITRTLAQAQQDISAMRARDESIAFMNANPSYYPCRDNYETIVNWLIKNKLAPVRENFQLAYDTLKAVGLLLDAPIVREEVPVTQPESIPESTPEPNSANSQPRIEEPSRITEGNHSQPTRVNTNIASGLTRTNTSSVGNQLPKSNKYSMTEINRMPSSEYKRLLLTDQEFKKFVDENVR